MRILLALFVVLGLAAVLLLDPFGLRKAGEQEAQKSDPALRELVSLGKDEISGFEIKGVEGDAFRVMKVGEQWFVHQGDKKYRAHMERVNKLLEDLPHLRSEALVTDKPDKYKDLEVDDGAAIRLAVYAGGDTPKLTLSVGKSGPGYNSAFVRLDGGKEVYRANKNIKTDVGFPFGDWRNKNPWETNLATVTEVSIAAPPAKEQKSEPAAAGEEQKDETAPVLPASLGAVSSFRKGPEYWQTASGSNAGQNAIKEFLKSLSELSINQFVDEPDPAKTGLANAQPAITVVTPEGTLSLSIGAKDNSQYYVKDQDGIVYQISEYNLRFYTDLDMSNLSLDDTPKEAAADEKDASDTAGKDEAAAPQEEKEPAEGKQEDKKSETDE
jgi:hypothetical protein